MPIFYGPHAYSNPNSDGFTGISDDYLNLRRETHAGLDAQNEHMQQVAAVQLQELRSQSTELSEFQAHLHHLNQFERVGDVDDSSSGGTQEALMAFTSAAEGYTPTQCDETQPPLEEDNETDTSYRNIFVLGRDVTTVSSDSSLTTHPIHLRPPSFHRTAT